MSTVKDNVTKIVTVLAVCGSAYLAGFTNSISVLTIPILPLAGPSVGVKQWAALYSHGSKIGPPMGIVSLSSFAFLAWAYGVIELRPRGIAFAIAALFSGANMPWTRIVMVPTNAALQKIADEPQTATVEIECDAIKKEKREEEVTGLIKTWRWMNAGRSVGPTIGALLGGAVAVGLI